MNNRSALAGRPISKFRSLNEQSDETLIKAITGSHADPVRSAHVRHSVRVFHFIARLVTDTARAEDLVSEVFIDVWSQAGRFEGRSQVSTWILSIARFKALSALRRRRDAQLDETSTEMIADTADTPEQMVLSIDRNAQLRSCIARMSREHREVIDLVYYHGKSVEEVAE
jgi:RNA polymerase sigma-70 factor (ECF subfamily)